MIVDVIPKLPFIDKTNTLAFYVNGLGFILENDYSDYLLIAKDKVEIHFFHYPSLLPSKSDFMIYLRVEKDIDLLFEKYLDNGISIHPNATLSDKPWGQREFSLLDPNGTLLTFGQSI